MDVDKEYALGLVKRMMQLEEWQEVSLVAGIDKQKYAENESPRHRCTFILSFDKTVYVSDFVFIVW